MRTPAREALVVWLSVMAALAAVTLLGRAVSMVGQLTGALAVAAFLYVPTRMLERRGQDPHDAGFRFDRLGRDVAWAVAVCAVVLPLFAIGFTAFVAVLPHLPDATRALLAPYVGVAHPLHLPWPRTLPDASDLLGRIAGNGAVAISEEYFYRGYLTLRLEERFPPRTRIFGAPLGLGALFAAILFALGHLLVPAPWRLFVFFPALIFAWLRGRTNTVVGAAICHFLFNVCLLLLERAAY